MKYTSEHTLYHLSSLTFTPRKRRYTASLLYVEDGLVCVRLGKADIPVHSSQGFWLPFGCLHALTIPPNTRVHQLAISPRIKRDLPTPAGHVDLSPLLIASFVALCSPDYQAARSAQARRVQDVMLDQVSLLTPIQDFDWQTKSLADCVARAQVGQPPANADQHHQLQTLTHLTMDDLHEYFTVRQLRAALKSGQTLQKAAASIGITDTDAASLYARYTKTFES
ncbi:hypothetical protein [Salinivibrio sp. ES.052]|uniref:hypothetical protein n=1 Tax=Salinivibrio sp. ES.052 TaxID=1882823 RepID=UPI000925EA1A|nr:hypothetical protein [Salinivibrio sp. ES.052]SIO31536.1 hypothetical protein SAMN05444724_2629 [Salinivibrio sp. ES.052]